MITVQIKTDTEEEMDTKVKMYFDTYPEQGYMTHIKSTYYDVTEVARLGSCD